MSPAGQRRDKLPARPLTAATIEWKVKDRGDTSRNNCTTRSPPLAMMCNKIPDAVLPQKCMSKTRTLPFHTFAPTPHLAMPFYCECLIRSWMILGQVGACPVP